MPQSFLKMISVVTRSVRGPDQGPLTQTCNDPNVSLGKAVFSRYAGFGRVVTS